jgi:hypothetical protein
MKRTHSEIQNAPLHCQLLSRYFANKPGCAGDMATIAAPYLLGLSSPSVMVIPNVVVFLHPDISMSVNS